ncbi:MAG: 2-amino-4-hydroxy-6-hydroxymethyldihydropteridine diphosphokinase, partial [Gammaproteobacteria bacterium]|nr:2-amino-4-hydroxy-6-hydroxymethyldihydropteridine diphosphokinase [Gammaproteobacteria bacterium]
MTWAWLGLGSNIDAERNIRSGVAALRETFEKVVLSPIYRSSAVGFEGEDFINLVVAVQTSMSPAELHDWLREVEDRHGRRRDVPKFSDRVLDIDILIFGDLVADQPELQLPRPEILLFAHVLKPLADLSPEHELPGDGRTLARVWAEAGMDDSGLVLIDPSFLHENDKQA